MLQGSLAESVLKVRNVVALWVGIRIQMSPRRNTCVIRDFPVTVVSSAFEASWLRWEQLSEESIVVGPEIRISGQFFCPELLTKL